MYIITRQLYISKDRLQTRSANGNSHSMSLIKGIHTTTTEIIAENEILDEEACFTKRLVLIRATRLQITFIANVQDYGWNASQCEIVYFRFIYLFTVIYIAHFP